MPAAVARPHATFSCAFTLLVLEIAGCGAVAPTTPIGMSDAPAEPAAVHRVEPEPAVWVDFHAAREWPEVAPAEVALVHRRDGAKVHVRVNGPNALAAYRQLSAESSMPEGARVAAWHELPTGELLGGYVLEKHNSVWSALEVDARGRIVPGEHAACVRCHDMAPTDHLFGQARSAASNAARSPPADAPASGVVNKPQQPGELSDPEVR